MKYVILTESGIVDFDGKSVETPFSHSLVHHGAFGNEQLAVIVDRRQIWIYDDSWFQMTESDIDLNCLLWTPQGLLVGTAGARLAWVSGEGLDFLSSFDEIPGRRTWTTPGGGKPDIRSLALDRNSTIYANIHVGWIARSTDGGENWEVCNEGLEKDVHMVATHPREEGVVFAATARGFHISQNSGKSFERRWKNFRQTYQRATKAIAGKETILVTVSNGPHSGGAKMYRSTDRGYSWSQVSGLPDDISKNINTYQITDTDSGAAFAIIENEMVFMTKNHGNEWELVTENLPKAYQVVQMRA